MPTITRGIIKSYDSGSHHASVQLAGSLAVWLDSLPVSDAIEPPEVVAGRECGVLFFTDDDPTDACVVSIHNATPLGTNRLRDADGDTRVEVERTTDEDKVAITIQGTLRGLFQASTPHLDLTGDQRVTGHVAMGLAGTNPAASAVLTLNETIGGTGVDGLNNVVLAGAGASGGLRGVTGEVQVQVANAGAWSFVRGLEFRATHSGSGTVTEIVGANAEVNGTGATGTRDAFRARMLALDNTATRRSSYYSVLSASVSATYTDYKAFLSEIVVVRSTITDFYHYALSDASLALGGALTTVYGYYSPAVV
ncbi:MAG TPA: hypothetical protein VMT90_09630, partial [Dehalococcoidia bacterium]|nr:hypothetical protein [Dehalococcoidia bacterium]